MLRIQINQAIKHAMRTKDQRGVATLRLINAAIKDREIVARGEGNISAFDDDQIIDLLQKMIKQRQESIRMYEESGQLELADQERGEMSVIKGFLPKQLSGDEIAAAVDQAIHDLGAQSVKDLGPLMTALRKRHTGQMDFARASAIAKERFS